MNSLFRSLSLRVDYHLETLKLVNDVIKFDCDAINNLKESFSSSIENPFVSKLIVGPSSLSDIAEHSQYFKSSIEQPQVTATFHIDNFTKLITKISDYIIFFQECYQIYLKETSLKTDHLVTNWEQFNSDEIFPILTSPHKVMLSLKRKLKYELSTNPIFATKKIANFYNAALNIYNILKNGWSKSCFQCSFLALYAILGYFKSSLFYGYVTCLSFGPERVFLCLFIDQLIILKINHLILKPNGSIFKSHDSILDSKFFIIEDVPEQNPFKKCVDILADGGSFRVQFLFEEGKNAFIKAFETYVVQEKPHHESLPKPFLLSVFFESCSICKKQGIGSHSQFCVHCGKWVCKAHMQAKRYQFPLSKYPVKVCDSCVSELQIN
jgi:hypothetical protein